MQEGKGGGGEKDGEEKRRGEKDGRRGSKGKRNGVGGEGQEEATLGLLWLLQTTHSVQVLQAQSYKQQ